jgi:DNA-binding NtrC family response regulator
VAAAVNAQKRTVLIADDDVDVAMALARAVRSMGDHQVFVAYSGNEALEMLRLQPVDLLLSDIDMPGIDGVTLAMHVRDESLAAVRILLTGNARLDTALQAMNRGEVYRYLTKPWSHDQLVATIDEALLRIGEMTRIGAVDRAITRLRAACEALEVEHPGITAVERDENQYVMNRAQVEANLELIAGSTLHLVLEREKSSS